MNTFQGIGNRVREIRLRLGQSIVEFAKTIDCKPQMLELLENDRPSLERQGLLPVLERIADISKTPIDVLLLSDTNLFTVNTSLLKVDALRIIRENRWTDSISILDGVFAQIEDEYTAALTEHSRGAIAFRGKDAAMSLDEDRVYEMVRKAKLTIQ